MTSRFATCEHSRTDSSQGGIPELFRVAYPIVLTQLSHSSMQIVDTAMVGRLGPTELGAVGFGGIWLWTALTFFVGTTQGVQTFVAQDYGAARKHETGAWVWQGLYAVLPAALVFIGIFALCLPAFLELIAPPQEIRSLTTIYVRARVLGTPGFIAYVVASAFFRGTGDTRTPLYITLFVVVINMILDYGLIFGRLGLPELGVQGAGLATAFAEWLGAILLFGALLRPAIRCVHTTSWAPPKPHVLARFMRTSAPVGIQWLLDMLSFAVFSTLVAHMGSRSIAATNVLIAMLSISIMLASGLSLASSTLVGQYIGARDFISAARAHRSAIVIGLAASLGLAALFIGAPELLIRVFTDDVELVELGTRLMLVGALLQIFDTTANISSGSLRGAGDTRWPLVTKSCLSWFVYLPLVYLLGVILEGGLIGAWAGCAINSCLVAITLMLRFQRGAWQSIRI